MFRGALSNSLFKILETCDSLNQKEGGTKKFELFDTRRNPVTHVNLIRNIVPNMKGIKNELGTIYWIKEEEAFKRIKIGDLVLSRVNESIFQFAYMLLCDNVPTRIIGEMSFKVFDSYYFSIFFKIEDKLRLDIASENQVFQK
jgi:hypothetical protein